MSTFHTPILLQEIVDFLHVSSGKQYIDATLGGGGHSFAIRANGGKVLAIDCDEDAVEHVKTELAKEGVLPIKEFFEESLQIYGSEYLGITIVRGNFKDIDSIARSQGLKKVDGILFDLGVSSHQIDTPERGFSFQRLGPLDMRMDRRLQIKALDLIAVLTKGELYELFFQLGEERFAHAISDNIVRARRIKPITTTDDLARLAEQAYGFKHGAPSLMARSNANRRIFQALRLAVNDERNNIQVALPKAIDLLENNGSVAVLSFHSLEDRIVKQTFLKYEKEGKGIMITKKPLMANEEEITQNPRSASAKLRVFQKKG